MQEAIKEVYDAVHQENLIVADLGCSSGPNTLLVLSEILDAIRDHCSRLGRDPPEIQYFMNDLPGNDFNTIFRYSALLDKKHEEEKGEAEAVPNYIVGVPGSFYGRLFPSGTVHFFHSSYCLTWLSQVPQELQTSSSLNKENIYITKTSPQIVVDSYLAQFQKDFSTFLKLRFTELQVGGQMVLTFVGRRSLNARYGEVNKFCVAISDAMNAMVLEGLLDEAKVNAYNFPIYTPSIEEVRSLIENQGLFHLDLVHIFESNWDPYDDSGDDSVSDNLASGENVAKYTRAVIEPSLENYFGAVAMDDLFSRFAKNVARQLLEEKTKHVNFVIVLKQ